jgi:hypothetical protein
VSLKTNSKLLKAALNSEISLSVEQRNEMRVRVTTKTLGDVGTRENQKESRAGGRSMWTHNNFEKKITGTMHISIYMYFRPNSVYLIQIGVKKATFLASSPPPSSWAGLLA